MKKKHKRVPDDRDTARNLASGPKSFAAPVHPAMYAAQQDPDANATDAEPDSDDYGSGS